MNNNPDWNKIAAQEWESLFEEIMSDDFEPERELVISVIGVLLATPVSNWRWRRRGAPKWVAQAITVIVVNQLVNRSYMKYYYRKSLQATK